MHLHTKPSLRAFRFCARVFTEAETTKTPEFQHLWLCILMCTCVMLAYCCSQSFNASCRCCSHRVWMALIWSSLWVSSCRSSSEHTHTHTLYVDFSYLRLLNSLLFLKWVLLVSSLALRPSWPSRLSRCSSLTFSAFSSLTRRSVGLSLTTARFWIRFALKMRGRWGQLEGEKPRRKNRREGGRDSYRLRGFSVLFVINN